MQWYQFYQKQNLIKRSRFGLGGYKGIDGLRSVAYTAIFLFGHCIENNITNFC